MALQLAPEEPEAGPWRTEPVTVLVQGLVEGLAQRVPGGIVSGRPVIVAIDGRSNSGNTSLAARIGQAVPGSAVIHTDDIAWAHSRFGWDDLLTGGMLLPVHRGEAVSYRPPRWAEHGREGSIDVPAGCPLLVIEGDGAGRREVAVPVSGEDSTRAGAGGLVSSSRIPRPRTSAVRGWITNRMPSPWNATNSAPCWSPPGSAHLSSMR